MAADGFSGAIDFTGLLNGIFGVGSTTTTNSSGTANAASLTGNQQALTSSISDLLSSVTSGSTSGETTQAQLGATTANQNTTNASKTTESSTTSSSQKAIDATQAQLDQATANEKNAPAAVGDMVSNILNQAGIAFGGTRANANTAGGYNSTSLDLLKNNAMAQAVAASASSVLSYMTGQQTIASNLTSSLLGATKTTTGDTSSTGTSAGTSAGTSVQDTSGTSAGTSSGTTNTADIKNATDLVSAVTGALSNQTTQQQSTAQSGGSLSVICTELQYQGKINKKLWYTGQVEFHNYSALSKKAYYLWANPSVNILRDHPKCLFSRILGKVFIARAHKKIWARTLVASICTVVGLALAFKHPVLFKDHCLHRVTKLLQDDFQFEQE